MVHIKSLTMRSESLKFAHDGYWQFLQQKTLTSCVVRLFDTLCTVQILYPQIFIFLYYSRKLCEIRDLPKTQMLGNQCKSGINTKENLLLGRHTKAYVYPDIVKNTKEQCRKVSVLYIYLCLIKLYNDMC